jgi:hypothetical protein
MTSNSIPKTIQTYRAYIRATPQAIWDALTRPEYSVKYGYAPLVEYELRVGGKVQPERKTGKGQPIQEEKGGRGKGFSMIKSPVESGWSGDAVVCVDSVGGDRGGSGEPTQQAFVHRPVDRGLGRSRVRLVVEHPAA